VAVAIVVEDGTGKADATTFANAASVATRLEANPYGGAFATTTLDKDAIVVEASRWLGRITWDGYRRVETQSLAFPRVGLITPDGYAVGYTSVPEFLLDAHARVCLYLAQQTETPFGDTGLAAGTALKVGPIELTPASVARVTSDIRDLIAPYSRGRSSLVRG
jgi:hypothetical protein